MQVHQEVAEASHPHESSPKLLVERPDLGEHGHAVRVVLGTAAAPPRREVIADVQGGLRRHDQEVLRAVAQAGVGQERLERQAAQLPELADGIPKMAGQLPEPVQVHLTH